MKDRIKEIMESEHMNNKLFANFTGINEGTLSLLLRDKAQPTLKIYEAIHKHFPNISMEWLFDGVGPMYKKGASADGNTSASAEGASGTVDGTSTSTDSSSASANGDVSSPSLFTDGQPHAVQASSNAKSIEKTIVKYVDKPQRKITEIRVFFDDQTWESFVPKG